MYKMILRVAYALTKIKFTNEFPWSKNCDTILTGHPRKPELKVAMGRTETEIAAGLTVSFELTERWF